MSIQEGMDSRGPSEQFDRLDPWARKLEVQTKLSMDEARDLLAAHCQPRVHAFRNANKLFVGTVSDRSFILSHRRRTKKHDPRQYRLTVFVRGRIEWAPRGSAITFVARPGAEFYGVPLIAVAVAFVYPTGSVFAAVLGLAVVQTIMAHWHIAEIFRAIGKIFDEDSGETQRGQDASWSSRQSSSARPTARR